MLVADVLGWAAEAGWKAAVLRHRGIEPLVAKLSETAWAELAAAQTKQKMVNAPAEDAGSTPDEVG